eukprot:6179223-Pleurochrysis_carterae.AAC.3
MWAPGDTWIRQAYTQRLAYCMSPEHISVCPSDRVRLFKRIYEPGGAVEQQAAEVAFYLREEGTEVPCQKSWTLRTWSGLHDLVRHEHKRSSADLEFGLLCADGSP